MLIADPIVAEPSLQSSVMHELRAHRRLAAWIAALALLLAALAPSLSVAARLAGDGSWAEVCTAQGAKWVRSDSSQPPDTKTTWHLFEHCPYCSIHVPALGLPPAPTIALHAPELAVQRPIAIAAAPRLRRAWPHARPRAPPSFS